MLPVFITIALMFGLCLHDDASALDDKSAMQIIDNALLKEYPSMKRASDGSVQPGDAYEMDYSEKCTLLDDAHQKSVTEACRFLNAH